jgi:hypothetical protein
MNISQVKNSNFIGTFFLRSDNSPNFISIEYSAEKELLGLEDGRVYLICSDGEIMKIGGSQSKGGIKATMSFYVNSMQGSPGKPRFIIHLLIRDELLKGRIVTLHMITSPKVVSIVNGLYSSRNIEVAAFKEMEDLCKSDYFKIEQCYPAWNFQENNVDYPKSYSLEHVKYHNNRLNKKND